MVRIFRNKKSISALLVLAYLLIGSGIGNAMLWCQESEAFSHLEYNLAGKCQHVCPPMEGSHVASGQTDTSAALLFVSDDCQDTQVSLSHAPASGGQNLLAAPVSPDNCSFHIPLVCYLAAAGQTRLNLAAKPPPPQALIALRTVVLLN